MAKLLFGNIKNRRPSLVSFVSLTPLMRLYIIRR